MFEHNMKNAYLGEYDFAKYQEVEYIQSSGTQYFKIGTQFKTSYITIVDFKMVSITGDQIPFGLKNVSTLNKYGINVYNSRFYMSGGSSNWVDISGDTNRHTLKINKSTAVLDETTYNINYSDYTFPDGLGVFYYNVINGSEPLYSANYLYKLDIYNENGEHIYDLIPCYRKSDNVIGMYDIINNVFYTNLGSGTFTKGPNVN